MSNWHAPPDSEPVRVLADGRDGHLTCRFLASSGIEAEVSPKLDAFCRDLEGVSVLIVAEERLGEAELLGLKARLAEQPAWSDLPIVIVAQAGGPTGRSRELVEALGNVSVLARPLRVDALITVVRSGIRARRRQFEVRDLLAMREEADRRKDEFLAMLAHELRNPLAPIRSAAGLMRLMKLQDDRLIEVRDVIDRQINHMARLIDDLLDVSRITRGTIELKTESVDLAEVARQAARSVSASMTSRDHAFDVTLPPDPVPVRADPTRIEQVIANLLSNAAKYTEPGGRVRLGVELRADEAVVRVRDDGVGIDPRILPRVFDLFTQADRSLDRSQGGLGIGLTIVKRLVDLHGGSVEARSDGPGSGTEMVVRLPVADGLPGRRDPPRDPSSEKSSDVLRVLLVEDSRDSAALLARVLRLFGHEVLVAHDGREALSEAPGFRPNVVVTDIGLPGLDGYELARHFRQDPSLGNPLLVAVTGYGRAEDAQKARDAGFDHHLVKPVDVEALASLIGHP
jgi:signal transduction histidine kinase/CheY-like chemotaxis protein